MAFAIQLWKADKFGLLGVSKGGFIFLKKNKILIRSKNLKLIYFRLEKYETSIKIFQKM